MKTIISLIASFFLLLVQQSFSQNIGINGTGANAHPSALLDVDDAGTNTKGLLIPRLALTAINVSAPVTAPATSLLVYNTATASTGTNAVSPGYYYWDGVKWVRFAYTASGSSAEAWVLLGNTGTNPATHFLGTTDNQDLVFRTNNIEKMRLTTNGVLRNTIPTNIIGVGGQGENTNSIIWGINTGGFAVGIYNASLASQSNGLVVKTASNSYSNTILDLTTGIDNVIGASVMNVRADGKVGIGTAIPLEKLHVFGGNAIIADNMQSNFNVSRTNQQLFLDNITSWSDNGIRIYDGNSNGHIHIGNVGLTYMQSYSPSSTVTPGVLGTSALDFDDVSNFSGIALNPLGGNVGIGTTTPSFKLHVPLGSIGTDYINTVDNAVTSGVTGIMVKQGDNSHRTGNAASVLSFLGITAPTGDNLGNHTATTTLNMNNNFINNAQGSSVFAQSNNTSTSYVDAPIQLRESQFAGGAGAIPPRLGLHWGGVVASQIGLESNGRIAILNNPGTGYENLVANEIYSNAWFRNITAGTGLYNEATATGIYSPSNGIMSIFNNGSLGIGTAAPTEKLEVQGSVKIVDGTQGAGRVLTSDANGKADWQSPTGFGSTKVDATGSWTCPWNGSSGGAGFTTGMSVTIPSNGWYIFETGLTVESMDCNDYSLYINGIGDIWKVYCSVSGIAFMVPRDQNRILYLNAGTYPILAAKTQPFTPTVGGCDPGNPSLYIRFVKVQI